MFLSLSETLVVRAGTAYRRPTHHLQIKKELGHMNDVALALMAHWENTEGGEAQYNASLPLSA